MIDFGGAQSAPDLRSAGLTFNHSGRNMRELTHFETSQASGAGTKNDNAEVVQSKSSNKNNALVNKFFWIFNGLFGTKIRYLK